MKSLSRIWLLATPWIAAYQAPPSMDFPSPQIRAGEHKLQSHGQTPRNSQMEPAASLWSLRVEKPDIWLLRSSYLWSKMSKSMLICGVLQKGEGWWWWVFIRKETTSTRSVMSNMRNMTNTAACYKQKLFREQIPRVLTQGEKFCFFNFASIWEDKSSLNLLWSSFHDVCMSTHYVIHLKFIQCCM